MSTLLIIDPQNDFIDLPAALAPTGEAPALPVAGAHEDMLRTATFIEAMGPTLSEVIVTMDSHASVAIERPGFWMTAAGAEVPPFTQITLRQVEDGEFRPRSPALQETVVAYLAALEAAARYTLMVWPTHCVTGTWGHNIHRTVAQALAQWEFAHQSQVVKLFKGMNPLTEAYSAVRAEVPVAADESTGTNKALLERLRSSDGLVFVAGEASSHCVRATLYDLFEELAPADCKRLVVLSDCMSPVNGFADAQAELFEQCARRGARVTTSAAARLGT